MNQSPGLLPAQDRRDDWATPQRKVVVVLMKGGAPKVVFGHVSREPRENAERSVMVWGEEVFNPLADHPDDAYEKSISLYDLHLLSVEEAKLIAGTEPAIEWFREAYHPDMAKTISFVLFCELIRRGIRSDA